MKSGFISKFVYWFVGMLGLMYWCGIVLLLMVVGILLVFINNVVVLMIFMLVSIYIVYYYCVSLVKVLLLFFYVMIFGGGCMFIGMLMNLLISLFLDDYGFWFFMMFEFVSFGLLFFGIGMVYNVFVMM